MHGEKSEMTNQYLSQVLPLPPGDTTPAESPTFVFVYGYGTAVVLQRGAGAHHTEGKKHFFGCSMEPKRFGCNGLTLSSEENIGMDCDLISCGWSSNKIELVHWKYNNKTYTLAKQSAQDFHEIELLEHEAAILDVKLDFCTLDPSCLACLITLRSLSNKEFQSTTTRQNKKTWPLSLKVKFFSVFGSEFDFLGEELVTGYLCPPPAAGGTGGEERGGGGGGGGCWLRGRRAFAVLAADQALVLPAPSLAEQRTEQRPQQQRRHRVMRLPRSMRSQSIRGCVTCSKSGSLLAATKSRLFQLDLSDGNMIRSIKGPPITNNHSKGANQNIATGNMLASSSATEITSIFSDYMQDTILVGTSANQILMSSVSGGLVWLEDHAEIPETQHESSSQKVAQIAILINGEILSVIKEPGIHFILDIQRKCLIADHPIHSSPISCVTQHPEFQEILLKASKDGTISVMKLDVYNPAYEPQILTQINLHSSISPFLHSSCLIKALVMLVYCGSCDELVVGCTNGICLIYELDYLKDDKLEGTHQHRGEKESGLVGFALTGKVHLSQYYEERKLPYDISDLDIVNVQYEETRNGSKVLSMTSKNGIAWLSMEPFIGGCTLRAECLASLLVPVSSHVEQQETSVMCAVVSGKSKKHFYLKKYGINVKNILPVVDWGARIDPSLLSPTPYLWDTYASKPIQRFRLDSPCKHMCMHPSKQLIHALSKSGIFFTYDTQTAQLKGIFHTAIMHNTSPLKAFPDSTGLYISYLYSEEHGSSQDPASTNQQDINKLVGVRWFELLSGKQVRREEENMKEEESRSGSIILSSKINPESFQWSAFSSNKGAFCFFHGAESTAISTVECPKVISNTIDFFMEGAFDSLRLFDGSMKDLLPWQNNKAVVAEEEYPPEPM